MFCWNTCPVKGILFHRAIFFYIALWKTVTTDPSIFTRPKFHEDKGSWWWQEIQIFIEGMKYFTQKNDSDISFTDSFHKETEYYWYKQNRWLHIRVNADRTCFHDDTSVLLMIYYTADASLFQNLLSLPYRELFTEVMHYRCTQKEKSRFWTDLVSLYQNWST